MRPIKTVSLLSIVPLALAQCPQPTSTAVINWPDDLYASRVITVSQIGSAGGVTTFVGAECPGNPYDFTLAFGSRTFSLGRDNGMDDYSVVQECTNAGNGMQCTLSEEGGMDTTITTSYGSDEIYTVSMAVVSSGASNTGSMPTVTELPYTGCPAEWAKCDGSPWCCPTTASICTTAPNAHEACATALNEDFPGPALPYISVTPLPPGPTIGPDSDLDATTPTGGAGVVQLPQATQMIIGGLVGLALI